MRFNPSRVLSSFQCWMTGLGCDIPYRLSVFYYLLQIFMRFLSYWGLGGIPCRLLPISCIFLTFLKFFAKIRPSFAIQRAPFGKLRFFSEDRVSRVHFQSGFPPKDLTRLRKSCIMHYLYYNNKLLN